MKPLKPAEILDYTINTGIDKSGGRFFKLLFLSIMAGAFIAFAAEGSNMAAFNLFYEPATYGLGKALAGAVFGTGLMLVVLCGGELFTGNTLILAAVCDKIYNAPQLGNCIYRKSYRINIYCLYDVSIRTFHQWGRCFGGSYYKNRCVQNGIKLYSSILLRYHVQLACLSGSMAVLWSRYHVRKDIRYIFPYMAVYHIRL